MTRVLQAARLDRNRRDEERSGRADPTRGQQLSPLEIGAERTQQRDLSWRKPERERRLHRITMLHEGGGGGIRHPGANNEQNRHSGHPPSTHARDAGSDQ